MTPKTQFSSACGSSGHWLFISAYIISSKVMCDDTCSTSHGVLSLEYSIFRDTYSNKLWNITYCKSFHSLKIHLENWFYGKKEFRQMILQKRILLNDFIVKRDFSKWFYDFSKWFCSEKDFVKWFYEKMILVNDFVVAKGFCQMILWRIILVNDFVVEKDFVKWFYGGKEFY